MTKEQKVYKNNGNKYQVVGNCEDVILEGTKQECINYIKKNNAANSKWAVVEMVAPGEKVECILVKNEFKNTNGNLLEGLFANE